MSTDLDDLIRRDDDLYDFNAPKIEAQADGRQSLTGKLDVLAALPSSASPSVAEQTDAGTGEVTEQTNYTAASAPNPVAVEAGQADPSGPDKASPATNSSSTQPAASQPAETAATGQAAPKSSSNPPVQKDNGAATASDGKVAAPKNEAEYVAYAEAWIATLTDAELGDKRWLSEKGLRNKANVGADARETLQAALAQKCREIRDADRT